MNSSSWSLIWWLRRVDPGDHRVAFVVKESAVPASLLETAAAPAVATSPVRTPKRAGLWSLPDVRWAALATALFAVGLIAHFAHAPSALAWSFFLVVDAAGLQIGHVLLVRPGERIGADGQVLSASSDVDQATITGEPLPVAKNRGDEVFAGTLNGSGALRVRVERAASDTVVARIVAMVEEAS